ncbi:MAG: ClpXP protease specificity-enhancing factor [Neptuniibacter sp.]
MKPSRPYIVKAIYEWLLDNDLTPHVLVDSMQKNVIVPQQFVQDDQIVLNIQPSAVRDFYLGDDAIAFNARFSGSPMDVYIPMASVMAIYARENGQGMGFGSEPGAECYLQERESVADIGEKQADETKSDSSDSPKTKKPGLRVVK